MGLFVVLCYLWPPLIFIVVGLALWVDWFTFLAMLPERDRQLAQASHGVGVIVCGAYLLRVVTYASLLPDRYRQIVFTIYGLLSILGIFWFLIGVARAQIFGDMHLLGRAVAKLAVGCAVTFVWIKYQHEIPWPYRSWIDPIATVVALWCWATGVTKIIICLRPMPRLAGGETADVYGGATAQPGEGLQGRDRRYRRRRT
jgi:hypothetical protein